MAITVRELILLPHLQLTLVAGAAGLDREVSWVHTSDLPNPWEWLGAGELLMTNGTGMSADAGGQIAFIEQLATAGASGLGFGIGTGPALTTPAIRCAQDIGLPLATVPFSLPFTTVVRAVADANAREEAQQLRHVARLYELLRASLLAGTPGTEMLRQLGSELGVRLYLVDPETGLSLLADGRQTAFAEALTASFVAHGRAIPGMLRLSSANGEASAVAVAVPGERPTALVVEPVGTHLPSPVLLQHMATGGALELAQLVAARQRQRRLGAELLGQLLDRRYDPRSADAQLADAGLSLRTCVLAALPAADDACAAVVYGVLDRRPTPYLSLRSDGVQYVVLPDADLDNWLVEELAGLGCPAGISATIEELARVPQAAEEAQWALGVAGMEQRPIARYGDETMLLLPRTPIEAHALATRILGPLLTYDAEHATQNVKTLRALLRNDRSWLRTSAELNIHKQTLGYRIHKIETLSGRGVVRTDHIAEWWIALRAYDLLSGVTGADP